MLTHRLANLNDLPDLHQLMDRAMRRFLPDFLDAEQVKASYEIMGVDSRLIEDGTYFVVLADNQLAGCGGWSRRETLFGGDHSSGRNPRRLHPATEPARVRAMYTNPNHARQGIGRLILQLCEEAAQAEGFQAVELAATAAGVPLYEACGYTPIKKWNEITSNKTPVPLVLMGKQLRRNQ
ncbi:Acetyltransferase, GNAT family [hydrothermal vent metagenome]|uniref:Acetyltransferase, GNAT family n=1 Tax=hydrothermal vent metagenome TaxID=652676 RepID=A0A3B0RZS7_9ZZZZ